MDKIISKYRLQNVSHFSWPKCVKMQRNYFNWIGLFDALRLGVWQLLSLDVYGLIIGRKNIWADIFDERLIVIKLPQYV